MTQPKPEVVHSRPGIALVPALWREVSHENRLDCQTVKPFRPEYLTRNDVPEKAKIFRTQA